MRLLVRGQLFFRLEYQLALLAEKFWLASLNERVMLHLRRQHEAAIFAHCRDWCIRRRLHFGRNMERREERYSESSPLVYCGQRSMSAARERARSSTFDLNVAASWRAS